MPGAIAFPAIVRAQLGDPAFVSALTQPAAASYTASATTFGGTTERMYHNTSTLTQTKSIILSCWVKFAADSNSQTIIAWRNDSSRLDRQSDNTLLFGVRSTLHNPAWRWVSAATYQVANGWIHFAASFHSDSTATRAVYVNGVAQSDALWAAYWVGETVLATDVPTLGIGAQYAGVNFVNGCLCEVYLCSQYIDLSANIGKFYNGGKPVGLGADGSTPTGVAPEYYFNNPYGTFNVNKGSLSATLTVAGTLASCTAP